MLDVTRLEVEFISSRRLQYEMLEMVPPNNECVNEKHRWARELRLTQFLTLVFECDGSENSETANIHIGLCQLSVITASVSETMLLIFYQLSEMLFVLRCSGHMVLWSADVTSAEAESFIHRSRWDCCCSCMSCCFCPVPETYFTVTIHRTTGTAPFPHVCCRHELLVHSRGTCEHHISHLGMWLIVFCQMEVCCFMPELCVKIMKASDV